MSIINDWIKRLKDKEITAEAEKASAEAQRVSNRAARSIAGLEIKLMTSTEHTCLVMELNTNESVYSFDELRNNQYHDSNAFLGAAKIVVNYCLKNGLDVYVWEHDFKMSSGSIGAEIWVTPAGIPFHNKDGKI